MYTVPGKYLEKSESLPAGCPDSEWSDAVAITSGQLRAISQVKEEVRVSATGFS